MRYLTVAVIFIAAFAVVSVAPSGANSKAANDNPAEAAQDRVTDVTERAETARGDLDDTQQTNVEEDSNDKERQGAVEFSPGRNPS